MPKHLFVLEIEVDEELTDPAALPELLADTFEDFPGSVNWREIKAEDSPDA